MDLDGIVCILPFKETTTTPFYWWDTAALGQHQKLHGVPVFALYFDLGNLQVLTQLKNPCTLPPRWEETQLRKVCCHIAVGVGLRG